MFLFRFTFIFLYYCYSYNCISCFNISLTFRIDFGYSHGSLSIMNIECVTSFFLFFRCRIIIYTMMIYIIITIMIVIIPLNVIGYINCFYAKKFWLLSSILLFISSNFTCNLFNSIRSIAINFKKYRYHLS